MSEDVPYIALKCDGYRPNIYLTYTFSSRNVMAKEDCKKEKLV